MTCNVGEPGLVLAAYALAGVLTLFGALAYAELATMMPEYNHLGAAYGRRWAFLYGWTQTFVGTGAGGAALSILFVVFLNDFVGGTLPPWALQAIPLVLLVVLVALNLALVQASGRIATALTAVKIALVLGIEAGAFMLGDGSWGHFAQSGAAAQSCGSDLKRYVFISSLAAYGEGLDLPEVPEAVGEAFNVGHVEPTTQRRFVKALARAAGAEPTLVSIPRSTIHAGGGQPMGEPLDMQPLTSVVDKAARLLDFEPTPLDEALRVSFAGYREQPRRPVDYAFEDRLFAAA